MDWFGLGILLQFKDNATSGILRANDSLCQLRETAVSTGAITTKAFQETENAMMSFNDMLVGGFAMQEFGGAFKQVSNAMLSGLFAIGQQTIATGSQFEQYRMTLNALYGDAETATAKANEAMNLAAKTPFEVQDVMEALIGFKAINVEALDTFEDLNGNARTLLEYIGDLAALRPDVGLQGVLLGVRNLLGGDNGKSLKMRMDIDFQDILGESWADTSEGMIEQLIRASQQIANGLMGELEGTWEQRISNLQDQLTRFSLAIADGGLFKSVGDSLAYFSEMIGRIDDERMTRIGKNISDAFSSMWKPVDFVIRKITDFVEVVINLIETNPQIAKVVTQFLAIGGAITGIIGSALVLGGTLAILVGGLNLVSMQLVKLPTVLNTFSKTLGRTMLSVSKLSLVTGGLYVAWRSDFLGIRSLLTTFMKNIYTAFTESARISKLGVNEMIVELEKLDTKTFGGWLTFQLVRLAVLWEALCESWNTNELSDETFQKVQYLGLLPLLSTILDLKAKAEAFFEGFKTGFKAVSDVVTPILQALADGLFWIMEKLFPIEEGVRDVNHEFAYLNLDKWERAGQIIGGLTVIGGLAKIIQFVTKPFGILGDTVGKVVDKFVSFGAVKGAFNLVKGHAKDLVVYMKPLLTGLLTHASTTIMSIATTSVAFLGGLPVWAVVAIGAVIAGLVALVVMNWNKIKEFTSQKWAEFTDTWKKNLEALGQGWETVCNNVKEWWANTTQWWSDKVEEFKNKALTTVEYFKQGFYEKIENIKTFFTSLRDEAEKITNKIGEFFSSMGNSIANVFKGVVNSVSSAINNIIRGINGIGFDLPEWMPLFGGKSFSFNIPEIPMLNTGGYIKDEGLSYLHPNEVVINDELTQRLREFLNDNDDPKPNNPLKPTGGFQSVANTTQTTVNKTEDNSVVFTEGSIQVTLQGGENTSKSAKEFAKEVIKEINRELKVRNSLSYKN